MKNLDVSPPVFIVSSASNSDASTRPSTSLEPASRLIVLVPESEADPAIVARKIRDAAKAVESRVQLIGLSKDAMREPGVRRRLATLAAMVEDTAIFVESKVEFGNSWLEAILPHWHRGDVIVCFAEHRSGFGRKPLHQILQSRLDATVYVLTGIPMQERESRPSLPSSLMAWSGSIVLLLVFFWLQAGLVQPAGNWVQTALLYLSIAVEGASLWYWNNLFG